MTYTQPTTRRVILPSCLDVESLAPISSRHVASRFIAIDMTAPRQPTTDNIVGVSKPFPYALRPLPEHTDEAILAEQREVAAI